MRPAGEHAVHHGPKMSPIAKIRSTIYAKGEGAIYVGAYARAEGLLLEEGKDIGLDEDRTDGEMTVDTVEQGLPKTFPCRKCSLIGTGSGPRPQKTGVG